MEEVNLFIMFNKMFFCEFINNDVKMVIKILLHFFFSFNDWELWSKIQYSLVGKVENYIVSINQE
jgi:hypothetical protein